MLVGRGGAAFPTGRKWQTLLNVAEKPKYIVCNADEGEPGTYKDRELLRLVPLSVIEGMIIAGHTFNSSRGFIFLRGEYRNLIHVLSEAIDAAKAAGYLGRNICGRPGFNFEISVVTNAGAYVCGEETALLNAIEGNRGEPRMRPPYPTQKGLFLKPTLINNTETFANIPGIIAKGAERFKSTGNPRGYGTKLFSLSGHVKNRGVYEVSLGSVSINDIIYDDEFGGGTASGRPVKFFHPGGQSTAIGFPEQGFTPYDYNGLSSVGLGIGSGAFVVMDESVCLVDYCKRVLAFFVHESCGKCIPCRLGTMRMLEILDALTHGNGTDADITRLEELADRVSWLSACGLGQASNKALASALKHRRDEFHSHANGNCPAKSCRMRIGVKHEQ